MRDITALWAFVPQYPGLRDFLPLFLAREDLRFPAVSVEETLELYWSGAGIHLSVEFQHNGRVEWYMRDRVSGSSPAYGGTGFDSRFGRLLHQYASNALFARRQRSQRRYLKAYLKALEARDRLETDRRERVQAVIDRLGDKMAVLAQVTG
jgi:hypothetical protein